MRLILYIIPVFYLCWLIALPLQAQGIPSKLGNKNPRNPPAASQAKSSETNIDEVWNILAPQVANMSSPDFLELTKLLVIEECNSESGCLFDSYQALMIKLERQFLLGKAILIGEEIARLANQENQTKLEAQAYENLSRYYDAIGDVPQALFTLDKAIELNIICDNKNNVLRGKVKLLEYSVKFRNPEEVLEEMDVLLREALQFESDVTTFIRMRLLMLAQDAERFDIMAEQLDELEKIPFSQPLKPFEYGRAINILFGRAQVLMSNNDLGEAEKYFQRTLQLCREEPGPWMEVHTYHHLAQLEIKKENFQKAGYYLDTALVKADTLDAHDLLSANYKLKAIIAESVGQYKEALQFTRNMDFHKNAFESRSGGFDIRSFYLQKNIEDLALQKALQASQLALQKENLSNSYLLLILTLALALIFVLGYYYQRKSKRLLAAQHALILEQTNQLKNLDDMKSKFFANVSHELRTPLTLILGPVHLLLKERGLREDQHKLLKAIRRSGLELKELVQEILDLGKLESGEMELKLEPITLSSFFSNFINQFDSMAQYKGIAFTLKNKLDAELVGDIDPSKCRQLLENLLSNAFKYTPPGGRIEVRLAYDQNRLDVEVEDSGAGIHPGDLPYVFNRYFQSTRPEKATDGGTGIGLALCKEYAQLFGGSIKVWSKIGEGSRFTVEFPVSLSSATAKEISAEESSIPIVLVEAHEIISGKEVLTTDLGDEARPTILVVEDNPGLQEYIQHLLTPKFSVMQAENGEMALQRLKSLHQQGQTCHLILTDLMMPVMDGHQLLEKLKSAEAFQHIPVIMLTARADISDKLKALRIGVDDYLSKPFVEEELMVRIDNLLHNQRMRQEAQRESAHQDERETRLSVPDQEWLAAFESTIKQQLTGSEAPTVSALARQFAMSESSLLRQLKRLTGLSPNRYLQEIRLDKARHLLENRTVTSIAQVASELGYEDVSSFSRSFKKRFGTSPSQWL